MAKRNDLTINECLCLMKAVRQRMSELSNLRAQVALTTTYYGEKDKVVTPNYDVKAVDKKITELQNFLYVADAKIKSLNARKVVDLEVDADVLLEPLG